MNTQKSLLILITFVSSFSFSQGNRFDTKDVLALAKVNPKMMEQKVSSTSSDNKGLKKEVAEGFLDMLQESVDLPNYLGSAVNFPSEYGLAYDSYELTVIKQDLLLSTIFTIDILDYLKFQDGLAKDMVSESKKDIKPFTEKGELVIIGENRVFTNKKKLIVIKTVYVGIGEEERVLVDDKKDAEEYTSIYGSKKEYEEEIRRLEEEEGLEVIREDLEEERVTEYTTEVIEDDYEVVEEVIDIEETVIEETDVEDEEIYYDDDGEDRYREIRYLGDYDLIENGEITITFLKGIEYVSVKSLDKYQKSKADIAFWINNEVIVDFGRGSMIQGLNMGLYDLFEMEWIPNAKFSMYEDSQSLMEVFLSEGEAVLDVSVYTNEELYDFSKRVSNVSIDDDILAYLPASSPAYSGFAFNYSHLITEYEKALVKMVIGMPRLDTIAIESWELMKLVIDEEAIAKVFSGQALTFVDGTNEYTSVSSEYYYDEDYNYVSKDTTITEERPSYFVILGTHDIATWGRIVRILEQLGLLEKKVGGIYSFKDKIKFDGGNAEEIGFYLTLRNGVIAMSNDAPRLLKLSQNSGKVAKEIKDKFKNKNSVTYTDFVELKKYLDGNDFGLPSIFSDVMGDYDSFEFSGMNFNKDNFSYKMTMKSKDSSINILQQLVNSINKVEGN